MTRAPVCAPAHPECASRFSAISGVMPFTEQALRPCAVKNPLSASSGRPSTCRRRWPRCWADIRREQRVVAFHEVRARDHYPRPRIGEVELVAVLETRRWGLWLGSARFVALLALRLAVLELGNFLGDTL